MADQTTAPKLRITCTRSGKTEDQIKTLKALGLARPGKTTTKQNTPAIAGMIKYVAHLVTVEELR